MTYFFGILSGLIFLSTLIVSFGPAGALIPVLLGYLAATLCVYIAFKFHKIGL